MAITSQGHVTTSPRKQANNEYAEGHFFIPLHLKKFCPSILEASHSKLKDPKQYDDCLIIIRQLVTELQTKALIPLCLEL